MIILLVNDTLSATADALWPIVIRTDNNQTQEGRQERGYLQSTPWAANMDPN